jgi:hypothetical protein
MEHQSFWETNLLSRLAVTQQIHIKGCILKNKGGFPSLPFRAGYRNGGYSLVPYMGMYYFIGHFNLWGKKTLFWSLTRCYVTFLKSVFFLRNYQNYNKNYLLSPFPLPAFLPQPHG